MNLHELICSPREKSRVSTIIAYHAIPNTGTKIGKCSFHCLLHLTYRTKICPKQEESLGTKLYITILINMLADRPRHALLLISSHEL